MSKVWAWIFGIAIALCILGLMAYGRIERRAYWAARGVVVIGPDSRPAGREVAVRASEPIVPMAKWRRTHPDMGQTGRASAFFVSAAALASEKGIL